MNEEKISNLRKLQLIQIDILNHVIEICNKHNIQYYLIGGTLLGAVRHKGFIPWDDDIDIAMSRKDYDNFIGIAKKELEFPYKIVHYTTDDTYKYLINIINENFEVTIRKITTIKSKVWIDILPIDGIPSNRIIRFFYKCRITYYRFLVGLKNIDYIRDKKRNIMEKILIKFAQLTQIGKLINLKKIREKNDKFVRKFKVENTEIVGTIFGNYGFHEIVPKKYFGNGSIVEFEGKKYNAPEKVNEYLTHMYGDYMKLPPIEKQTSHHIIDI